MAGYSYLDKIKAIKANALSGVWKIRGNADPLIPEAVTRRYDGRMRQAVSPEAFDFPTGEKVSAFNGGYIDFPIESPIVPSYNGTSSYTDIYSSDFANSFDGAEGSVSIWCKVSGAGVWTDGVFRMPIRLRVDANNIILIEKHTANDRITFLYHAGGTSEIYDYTISTIDWFHLCMTWSATDDEVKFYANGVLENTATTLGTWAGSLASTTTVIGAATTTSTFVWSGNLSHASIYNYPLSISQIQTLYTTADLTKIQYEQNTLDLNPIAYFPLDEFDGTPAVNLQGNSAMDGTHSNVTLNASLFTPITKKLPFDKNQGTAALWFRGNDKYSYHTGKAGSLLNIFSDADNHIKIEKQDNKLNGTHSNVTTGSDVTPMLSASAEYNGTTSYTDIYPAEKTAPSFDGLNDYGDIYPQTLEAGSWDGVVDYANIYPQTLEAGSWDGTNDYADIYSAGLAGAFDGAEGSISIWCKVSGSGVWTDGTENIFFILRVDANNQVLIEKRPANNTIGLFYYAGGTPFSRNHTTSTTDWVHLVLTWSVTNDEVKYYADGVLFATDTVLGTWSGALSSSNCVIGAFSTSGNLGWDGNLAQASIYDYPLTQANVTSLFNIGLTQAAALTTHTDLSPIAYFPLNEQSGTTAEELINEYDGTYSGVTLAQAHFDPFGLTGAWNGDEFSVSGWFKVSGSGVWTDGSQDLLWRIRADANNDVYFHKPSSGSSINLRYDSGGTTKTRNTATTTTDWFHLVLTVSISADEVKVYFNGVQSGGTISSLSAWTGGTGLDRSLIGAGFVAPIIPWSGNIAHVSIYDYALTPANVTSLYNIGLTQAAAQANHLLLNPIAYYPLNEQSGTTINDESGNSYDGTFSGVTLAQAHFDPFGLTGAFDGDEGSISIWCKVSGSGVWTDGVARILAVLYVDASNQIYIQKHPTNNWLVLSYNAGGTTDNYVNTSFSETNWFNLVMTWSASSDQVKFYIDGTLKQTSTGLGTWAGTLSSTGVRIGRYAGGGGQYWSGNIAHVSIYDTPLAQAAITDLFDAGTNEDDYISKTVGYNPIAYYPLNEKQGTTIFDQSANDFEGLYSGVTLRAAHFFPFDLTGFFDGDEGSVSIWAKVANAGVWTDGQFHYFFAIRDSVSTSFVAIYKNTTNNALTTARKGTTARSINATISTTDWFHVVFTWSVNADEQKTYINGVLDSTHPSSIDAFVGEPDEMLMGSWVSPPNVVWDGFLAQAALFTRPLTATEVANLYVTTGVNWNAYLDRVHAKTPAAYWMLDEPHGDTAYNRTIQPIQAEYTQDGSGYSVRAEVRDDDWHSAIMTWNRIGMELEFFLDGVSAGTSNLSGFFDGDPVKMYAGANQGSITDFWEGGEAYLALWTDLLDSDDVAAVASLATVNPTIAPAASKGAAIHDYQIFVIDPSTGEKVDYIDNRRIHSMDYKKTLNGVGSFQLTVFASDRLETWFGTLDLIMEVYRRNVDRFEKEETYFVRNFTAFEDKNGIEYLIFGGESLISFFRDRPIVPDDDPNAANGFSTKGGATALPANLADNVMLEFVDNQVINPNTNTDRIMSGLSNAASQNLGNPVFARIDYQTTLLQLLNDLSVRGIIDYQLERTTGANFEFSVLHIGSDRTKTTNYPGSPFVYFSEKRGNLIEPKLVINRNGQITRTWVQAQGIESDRITVAVDSSKKLDSPFNLRENVSDAREIENNATMLSGITTSGLATLDENKGTRELSFKIDNNAAQSKYNVDWFLGDKVTASYKGFEFDYRIRSVTITVSGSKENISPKLEELDFGSN